MAWLGQAAGTQIAKSAPLTAGVIGGLKDGGFSGAADFLKSNGGRDAVAGEAEKQTQQASATAAASSADAASKGMQFAGAGGQTQMAPSAPAGVLPSSGYNPMNIFERLAAFRGR